MDLHPSDISNILKSLVEKGLLSKNGIGRGSIYTFTKGEKIILGVLRLVDSIKKKRYLMIHYKK
jgi:hypothetical protein